MTVTGEPAFPNTRDEFVGGDRATGMALRDWFAGKALEGVLASNANPNSSGAIPVDDGYALFVAEHCYRYADAMLKAREGTCGTGNEGDLGPS